MNNLNDVAHEGLYVIRFLNTDLAGCEYLITEKLTHYIANSSDDLKRRQELLISSDYIFVPDENLKASFDIETEDASEAPLLILPLKGESRHLSWQKITDVDGVCFALKQNVDEIWSQDVLDFSTSSHAPEPDKNLTPGHRWLHVPSVIALSLALILLAWTGYQYYADQQRQNDLSLILGAEQRDFQIGKGRDGWYVFATQPDKRDWATRALIRAGEAKNTAVISKNDEAARISNLINQLRPDVKFHVIRLDNPFVPEIVLSKERGGLQTQTDYNVFREMLLLKMAYATDLTFSHVSDSVVANQADQAMRKTGAHYSREQHADSITYITRGALDDNELNQLKSTVQQFNNRWQGNYIRFAVELENDWLKGKSYQYGAEGYVKMNPKHWYFPLDIRDSK